MICDMLEPGDRSGYLPREEETTAKGYKTGRNGMGKGSFFPLSAYGIGWSFLLLFT